MGLESMLSVSCVPDSVSYCRVGSGYLAITVCGCIFHDHSPLPGLFLLLLCSSTRVLGV